MYMLLLTESAIAPALRERATFEELYAAYYQPILAYLRQLSGVPEQAEDLVQETFVKAYVGLVAFRGESSAATWLYRIARNTYLNAERRQGRAGVVGTLPPTLHAPPQQADPAAHYAAREQRLAITRALATLPELQRSIVLLRDGAGLSYGEIGAILGLSVGAVRMQLFRARNNFRAAYTALEPTEGAADEQL